MTTLLNTVDARAPNLAPQALRVVGAQFQEDELTAAGTYRADIFLPAYAFIFDIVLHSEELWNASTTANVLIQTFLHTSGVLGAQEGTNAILGSTSVKATNLTKGQSITLMGDGAATLGRLGAIASPISTEGTSTHMLNAMMDHDRWVRCQITTTGTVGTLGETMFYLVYAIPEMDIAVAELT
jgi:hypothetical protein